MCGPGQCPLIVFSHPTLLWCVYSWWHLWVAVMDCGSLKGLNCSSAHLRVAPISPRESCAVSIKPRIQFQIATCFKCTRVLWFICGWHNIFWHVMHYYIFLPTAVNGVPNHDVLFRLDSSGILEVYWWSNIQSEMFVSLHATSVKYANRHQSHSWSHGRPVFKNVQTHTCETYTRTCIHTNTLDNSVAIHQFVYNIDNST